MRKKAANVLLSLLEQDQTQRVPLSLRLQNAVRRLIVDGHLAEGERLPSTRTMATDLGLARDTIEAAYQHLEMEGFLERHMGSGTFVTASEHRFIGNRKGTGQRSVAGSAPRLNELSRRGQAIARSGGVPDHASPKPFVVLPDVQSFPLEAWLKLNAKVIRSVKRETLLYADPMGYPPLREEIARYLSAHRGVECSADQILVLNSSQQALGLIASLLMEPGERVGLEEPGFHGARQVFCAAALRLESIPVDEEGISSDRLEKLGSDIRAVYVTPSHQYPLGATLSLQRRLALVRWAERTRGWIIEDDYDSEFRYDGRPIAAIQSLAPSGRVLYVGTFSKVLFPGLRLAYLVLPPALVPAFVSARTLIDGHTAIISQAVLTEFMREGHFATHIRRMRQIYHARRDAFAEAFEKHLSPFASMIFPSGGLHLTALLSDEINEASSVSAAARHAIELPTLRRLYAESKGRQGWLMGFAALPPGEAEKAMRKLAKALQG
ncbi:PLP-dependent aminotransferase family protein [Hyphomicrobium sp. NDB2Meth4]|uniref:MocR-like pyridoxine biosynthesis transcription factor PdxR n=1 Tax=Hyphomicrobium sp. NDB2Meth4 TaxID=1892846 RepID=UPI000930DFF7|nr:PLP-dependent aminotransferase family protein [Hyphomicrobium sp. NDB2Meth4]